MSYNIDSEDVLECDATIAVENVASLLERLQDQLPEICFLDEFRLKDRVNKQGRPDANGLDYKIKHLWWSGEGSGNSFDDVFLAEVVPCIKGAVDLIVCYEGGDSFRGFRIADGEAVEMKVVRALAPMEKT